LRGPKGPERALPPPLSVSGWGEAGEPDTYDPGAPTGEVGVPARDWVLTAPQDVAAAAGTVAAAAGIAAAETGTVAGEANEGAGVEAGEAEDVTRPVVLEGALAATVPAGERIRDGAGAMEYPREVVPPAGATSARQGAEREATMTTGEGPELPHWADPPTGEVPAALVGAEGSDELQAWRLLGSRGLHWRDDVSGWEGNPGVEDLVDEANGPISAEGEGGDPFSFDEDFDRLERERARSAAQAMAPNGGHLNGVGDAAQAEAASNGPEVRLDVFPPALSARRKPEPGPRRRSSGPAPAPEVPPPGQPLRPPPRAPYDVAAEATVGVVGGRNVGAAVATGTGLIAVFVVCYLIGPLALLALAALGIVGCAFEAYGMLQEVGFRPATLVGVLGSAGAVLAAYWKGTAALPVVVAVVLAGCFAWYLARVVEARPVVNAAVSFLVFAWVGVLGSFAGLLLEAHKGSHLFFGAVVPTVLADAAAWLAGSSLGSHPLAPHVSPGKTWEGVIAGAVVAVVAAAVIGHELSPWGGLRHGVELGVLVAIVAPIGDLVQSMVKRDLRVKDSGTVLPGHGGLLDRFDSLLFVLPAVYFLAVALHLAH